MTRTLTGCAAALLALAVSTAEAAPRKEKPFSMSWFGFGVGLVNGSVDLPCDGGGGGCGEAGVFPSYHLDWTVAAPVGFRLRAVRAEEDTRHKPREIAAMIGFRLARKWYGYVGMSNILHADNDFDGTATGLAWELVRAHRDRDRIASQSSIMGHVSEDVTYIGVSFGFRIGDLR